jgi:hypothetical protein
MGKLLGLLLVPTRRDSGFVYVTMRKKGKDLIMLLDDFLQWAVRTLLTPNCHGFGHSFRLLHRGNGLRILIVLDS